MVVLQHAFGSLALREKDILDVLLVLLEFESPVGEGKQDRPLVSVPRIRPIAESFNLAFNKAKDLAEDPVEVGECVGEDISPKVGWEFGARWVPEQYGLGICGVPCIVVSKFMGDPQVIGDLDRVWFPKWDELKVDWECSTVIRFPFAISTRALARALSNSLKNFLTSSPARDASSISSITSSVSWFIASDLVHFPS